MKKIAVLVVAVVMATFAFGQRVMEGEKQVNGGLGFNSGGWGIPFYVGVDYGIYPDITVGGIASYMSKDYNYGNGYKNTGHWLSIGAKGDYHFNTVLEIPDEWDLYAGATLAYNSFSYSNDWNGNHGGENSGLGFGLQIGGRYYFMENWAVNLELGGGSITSGGRIGVSYKF